MLLELGRPLFLPNRKKSKEQRIDMRIKSQKFIFCNKGLNKTAKVFLQWMAIKFLLTFFHWNLVNVNDQLFVEIQQILLKINLGTWEFFTLAGKLWFMGQIGRAGLPMNLGWKFNQKYTWFFLSQVDRFYKCKGQIWCL